MGKGDSFNRERRSAIIWCTVHFVQMLFLYMCILSGCVGESGSTNRNDAEPITHLQLPVETVDSLQYCRKIQQLANNDEGGFWPVKNQPCPLKRAVLPKKRIVAYYGNLYSKRMGALGQYPPAEMWQRLHAEVRNWKQADSLTPVHRCSPPFIILLWLPNMYLEMMESIGCGCPIPKLIRCCPLQIWERPLYSLIFSLGIVR